MSNAKGMAFESYLNEKLKDPEFARMWEEEQPEIMVSVAVMSARKEEGLTQEDLAKATGLKQNAISRVERGETNPTLATLQKIAEGLNRKLVIAFE